MPHKKLLTAWLLGLGLTLTIFFVLSGELMPITYAASFTVSKLVDTNDGECDTDCSLREAIIASNGNDQADTIDLGPGTYTLEIPGSDEQAAATGDLDITEALTT